MDAADERKMHRELMAAPAGLSPTMQAAVEFAKQHGGKLHRFPGGFWCHGPEYGHYIRSKSFGTPTVAGLRARGIGEYTEWKDGRGGLFPIVFTLKTPI